MRTAARSCTRAARVAGRPKVFGIGCNKTGTTSLARALAGLGIPVAPQAGAERLLRDWTRRDFRRIVRFCRFARGFQDVPFSLPYTYQALDQAYPGSKFILTIRGSAEAWYDSLTRFHAKLFGNGRVPTAADLRRARYRYPGYALEATRDVFGTPESDLYHRPTLLDHYRRHNADVIEYFRHRPGDLLVLDVAAPGAYAALCRHLERPVTRQGFPWENKTDDAVPMAAH